MVKTAISVIVPVYNGERYLEECLDSILHQSFQSWQMICINDGSTDHSLQILEHYVQMDDRISVLTQENRGLSASRNTGLDCAEGEYLLFLDCDDRLTSGALEYLYAQASRDQLDILYYDGDVFFNDALEQKETYDHYKQLYRAKTRIDGVVTGIDMLEKLFEAGSYRASACMQMIRRMYLEHTGIRFCPGILYEDNIFTLETMTQAERTGYCHTTIYERRIHKDSIVTQTKGFSDLRSYVMVYLEMMRYALQKELPERVMPCLEAQLSLMRSCAIEAYHQMNDEKGKSLNQMSPQERLICENVACWEVYYGPEKSVVIRAIKGMKHRMDRLHDMLRVDGVRKTLCYCTKRLYGRFK